MSIQDEIQQLMVKSGYFQMCDELVADYLHWKEAALFNQYQQKCMDREKVEQSRLNGLSSPFHNGKKGVAYSCSFRLPEGLVVDHWDGLTELSLQCVQDDNPALTYTISGIPNAAGDAELTLFCTYAGWVKGKPMLSRKFRLVVNPDPSDLWVDTPTDSTIEYYKPDSDSVFIPAETALKSPAKTMLAASRRGRSHGHEGKPRDDHFGLRRNTVTGWDILAVADGAGSAPFSRQGSNIACETVTRFCDEHIATEEMEACIRSFGAAPEDAASRRQLETAAYKVLCKAAFAAYQAIHTEAQARGRDKKDYATTLLFALCKYFDFGWFVVSFGVGDGAMAILEQAGEGLFVRLLAEPDEGEFGGQTRFLTMDDIFRDPASLQRRIHVEIVPDFTAILLMTDGVSDAKFETDANLHNPHKWDVLWQELVQAVPLKADGEEAQQKLLDWLNFWSPGNHDDRTLALLY